MVDWNITPDNLLYASYSRGYKSGGINPPLSLVFAVSETFAPEFVNAFEIGSKNSFAGGKIVLNLTGFYYDYKNLQVSQVQGTSVLIQNAAKAEVYGLEAEISAIPAEHLLLEANISLLHSEYKDFVSADPARAGLGPIDLAGNQLTQVPEYTVNLNASYTIPTSSGDFILRGEGRWVDTPVAPSALFSRGAGDLLHVTYDAATCSAQALVILFNSLGNWNGYSGCAQSDGGNSGFRTVDSTGQTNVWYNLVWTAGTTSGHPGFASSGPRTWNVSTLCGMAEDDHGRTTCP